MVADLPCAVRGKQSAHVELVAPGELPAGWADWDSRRQESYNRHHDPGRWRAYWDEPIEGSRLAADRRLQIRRRTVTPTSPRLGRKQVGWE